MLEMIKLFARKVRAIGVLMPILLGTKVLTVATAMVALCGLMPQVAWGGDTQIGTSNEYYARFTSNGTWKAPENSSDFRVLLVGGGGAGGGSVGGGGGAGEFYDGSANLLAGSTYNITVGAGGTASTGQGGKGGSSSIGTVITVNGGGGGGSGNANLSSGLSGGSGGGGGYKSPGDTGQNQTSYGGTANKHNGSNYYAFDGGTGYTTAAKAGYCGGGGGAGGAGVDGTASKAGNGGAGKQSDITGVATYYAAGGGGGTTQSSNAGTGGNGGGGAGGTGTGDSGQAGSAATANTGSGGGGGGGGASGGAGATGVVIIRYTLGTTPTPTGVTATTNTANNVTTVTFTGSGTLNNWLLPANATSVKVLIIGGGGGGGRGWGGGGGAGEMYKVSNASALSAGTSYSIVVGQGGRGGYEDTAENGIGQNGGDSEIKLGSTIKYHAKGGGGGGTGSWLYSGPGQSGGSGGGGGGHYGGVTTVTQLNPGSASKYNGTASYGYDGAVGVKESYGGGGGGAASGKTGGNGKSDNISGADLIYAAGGFGGNSTAVVGATPTVADTGANAGSGGGGGGAGKAGGAGANGIVVIQYTIHTHSYSSTVTTPATCTATGVRTCTCSCGDSYMENIPIDSNNHSWGDWVVSGNEKTRTCSRCGKQETQSLTGLTTNAMSNVSWGYIIEGLSGGDVAYVYTNATANMTFTAPQNASNFRVLLVGGGGGGGSRLGGGGGAGEFYDSLATQSALLAANKTYTIDVGLHGSGANSSTSNQLGENGSSSSITENGVTVSVKGGGGGGSGWTSHSAAQSGGSGGGGSGFDGSNPIQTTAGAANATQTSGQVHNGGTGYWPGSGGGSGYAGGGGGAGGVGGACGSTSTKAGNGGEGATSDITGSTVTYAAGGGGGTNKNDSNARGAGGSNIGGAGGYQSQLGGDAEANTGSGGGGGGGGENGGNGANGIVVIRYSTHTHSYSSTVTTPATCTATGVRTCTCSCGDSYTENIPIDSNNHSWGNWVTLGNEKTRTCSRCGKQETQSLTGLTTNAMSNVSWGYIIEGLSGGDVAYVYTNATLNNMTFAAPQNASNFRVLLVGGGGGGGSRLGGGGGAGEFYDSLATQSALLAANKTYTIDVGLHGSGANSSTSNQLGGNGSSSSITGNGVTVSVEGGGGGGSGWTSYSAAQSGGSGGGGSGFDGSNPIQTTAGAANATQTSGQVHTGGTGYWPGSGTGYAGGGGGAGGAGGACFSTSTKAGNGGAGATSDITGSTVTYAAGGGGGTNKNDSNARGSGGSDIGGNGGYQLIQGGNAVANTGSGGGGGGGGENGGNGADGIVIIRFSVQEQAYDDIKFGVISDLHFGVDDQTGSDSSSGARDATRTDYVNLLNYFKQEGVHAVIFTGDIGNNNASAAVGAINKLKEIFGSQPVVPLFVAGNHEAGIGDLYSACGTMGTYNNNSYWTRSVRGFKFVGVHWNETDHTADALNAAGLSSAYKKPFFVFEHPSMANTVYGKFASFKYNQATPTTSGPTVDAKTAMEACAYKAQAFVITGHDHYSLTDDRGIWQGSFTAIASGSFWSSIAYWGIEPHYYIGDPSDLANCYSITTNQYCNSGAEGQLAFGPGRAQKRGRHAALYTVTKNSVTIKRLDFTDDNTKLYNAKQIDSDWVVPLNETTGEADLTKYPFATHKASRVAPQFESSAELTIDGQKVTFPRAQNGIASSGEICRPFAYEVKAKNTSGTVLKTHYILDKEYCVADESLSVHPEQQFLTFASSEIGGANSLDGLIVEVTPLDSFGNRGAMLSTAPCEHLSQHWVVTTAPTATAAGTAACTCTVCGQEVEVTIPANTPVWDPREQDHLAAYMNDPDIYSHAQHGGDLQHSYDRCRPKTVGTKDYDNLYLGEYVADATAPFYVTNAAPRVLSVPLGDGNYAASAHDLGGWPLIGGGTTKQGVFFRSGSMDALQYHTDQSVLSSVLGIKTEIDLRGSDEASAVRVTNGQAAKIDPNLKYYNYPFDTTDQSGWKNLSTDNCKNSVKDVFAQFADAASRPAIFHCTVGRDRTGLIAQLLMQLVGCTEESLYRDYLLSWFANGLSDGQMPDSVDKRLVWFYQMGDDTLRLTGTDGSSLAALTGEYLKACGVTAAQLDAVCQAFVGETYAQVRSRVSTAETSLGVKKVVYVNDQEYANRPNSLTLTNIIRRVAVSGSNYGYAEGGYYTPNNIGYGDGTYAWVDSTEGDTLVRTWTGSTVSGKYIWKSAVASGDWNNKDNWALNKDGASFPHLAADWAIFESGTHAVTLNNDYNLHVLSNRASSVTIDGQGHTLTFNKPGDDKARIFVGSGDTLTFKNISLRGTAQIVGSGDNTNCYEGVCYIGEKVEFYRQSTAPVVIFKNGRTTIASDTTFYSSKYGYTWNIENATVSAQAFLPTKDYSYLKLEVTLGANNNTTTPALDFAGNVRLNESSTLTIDATAKGAGTYPILRVGGTWYTGGDNGKAPFINNATITKSDSLTARLIEESGLLSLVLTPSAGYDLSKVTATIQNTAIVYTGSAVTPAVTVVDTATGVVLKEGVHYTVSYANNTDVGEATATITAQAPTHGGPLNLAFTISPVANGWRIAPSVSDYLVGGTPSVMGEPEHGTCTISYAGINGTTYGPSESAPTAEGSYCATFTVEPHAGYAGLTEEVLFYVVSEIVDPRQSAYLNEFIWKGSVANWATENWYIFNGQTAKWPNATAHVAIFPETLMGAAAANLNGGAYTVSALTNLATRQVTVLGPGSVTGGSFFAGEDSTLWVKDGANLSLLANASGRLLLGDRATIVADGAGTCVTLGGLLNSQVSEYCIKGLNQTLKAINGATLIVTNCAYVCQNAQSGSSARQQATHQVNHYRDLDGLTYLASGEGSHVHVGISCQGADSFGFMAGQNITFKVEDGGLMTFGNYKSRTGICFNHTRSVSLIVDGGTMESYGYMQLCSCEQLTGAGENCHILEFCGHNPIFRLNRTDLTAVGITGDTDTRGYITMGKNNRSCETILRFKPTLEWDRTIGRLQTEGSVTVNDGADQFIAYEIDLSEIPELPLTEEDEVRIPLISSYINGRMGSTTPVCIPPTVRFTGDHIGYKPSLERANNNCDVVLVLSRCRALDRIELSASSGLYDGQSQESDIAVLKVYNTYGEEVDPSCYNVTKSPNGTSFTHVGKITVTVTANNAAAALGYEVGETIQTTYEITPAPLTLTVEDKTTTTQASAIPALTYSLTGWVNGEGDSRFETKPQLSTTCTSVKTPGVYAINATPGVFSAGQEDYKVTVVPGTLTVNEENVALKPTLKTAKGSYTGLEHKGQVTPATLSESDMFTYSWEGDWTSVGKHTVTATLKNTSTTHWADADNTTAPVVLTYEITPATLMATPASISCEYGDAVPSFVINYVGFQNGETAATVITTAPVASTTYTQGALAGTKHDITLSGGSVSPNYQLVYKKGTLTVTLKRLDTPAPEAQTKTVTYNGTVWDFGTVFGYPPGSLVVTEGLSGEPRDVGEYTASLKPAANYCWKDGTDTSVTGFVLTIEQFDVKDATITASPETVRWDGEGHAPTLIIKNGDYVIPTSDYTWIMTNSSFKASANLHSVTNVGTYYFKITPTTGNLVNTLPSDNATPTFEIKRNQFYWDSALSGNWTEIGLAEGWTNAAGYATYPNSTSGDSGTIRKKGATIDLGGVERNIYELNVDKDAAFKNGTLKYGYRFNIEKAGLTLTLSDMTVNGTSSGNYLHHTVANTTSIFERVNFNVSGSGVYELFAANKDNNHAIIRNGDTTGYKYFGSSSETNRKLIYLTVENGTVAGDGVARGTPSATDGVNYRYPVSLSLKLGANNEANKTKPMVDLKVQALWSDTQSGTTNSSVMIDATAITTSGEYQLMDVENFYNSVDFSQIVPTVAEGYTAELKAKTNEVDTALVDIPHTTETTKISNFQLSLIIREKIAKPTAITGLVYDGTEQTGVAGGTGYTLTNHKATNAGTHTATATLAEGYCWADNGSTDAASISWSIAQKTLTDAMVTVSPATATYNGQNQKPTVTVTDSAAAITTSDYTITNNGGTNVGKYNVTVVGKGNYTGTVTLSECFEIKYGTYTITVEGNGGTAGSAPDYITAGDSQTVNMTKLPIRTGYFVKSFAVSGGNSAETGVTATKDNDGSITIPANTYGNLTITPTWGMTQYDITIKPNGGNGGSVSRATYTVEDTRNNSILVTITPPTRNGYHISSWTASKGSVSGNTFTIPKSTTGNITLTPTWEADTYTITCQKASDDETETLATVSPAVYNINESAAQTINITLPARTNYKVVGFTVAGATGVTVAENAGVWQISIPKNTIGNLTLTPIWERKLVAFIFNSNGGKANANGDTFVDNARVIPLGAPMTYNANLYPDKSIYVKASSRISYADGGIATVNAMATVGEYGTLDMKPAAFLPNDFMAISGVNFRTVSEYLTNESGSITQIKPVEAKSSSNRQIQGDYINENIVAGSVYYLDATNVLATTGDYMLRTTIYYNNEANTTNTFRFSLYAGRPSAISATSFTYQPAFDGYIACDLPVTTRAGYTFKGWNTAADGSGTPVTAEMLAGTDVGSVDSATTLYAIWERTAYGITYDNLFNLADFATKENALNRAAHGSVAVDLGAGSITLTRNANSKQIEIHNYVCSSDNTSTYLKYYSIPVTVDKTYVLQFDVQRNTDEGKWKVDFYTYYTDANNNGYIVSSQLAATTAQAATKTATKKTIEVTPIEVDGKTPTSIMIRFFAQRMDNKSDAVTNTITYSNIKFYEKSDALVASATPWGTTIPSDATQYVVPSPNPTLEGASFTKWTLDKAGTGEAITSATTLPTPVTSKALWSQWNQVIAVPTANTPTYNGTEQTGVSEGTGYMLTGTTKATNAGPYTATVTPAEGYCWSDGSTDPKNVPWTIAKAPLTITLPDMTTKPVVAEGAPTDEVEHYIRDHIKVSGFVSGESEATVSPTTEGELDLGGYTEELKIDFASKLKADGSTELTNITATVTNTFTSPIYENYKVTEETLTAEMRIRPGFYTWNGAATGAWNDPNNWTTLEMPEGYNLSRGYPDNMGARVYVTNMPPETKIVTITIPRMDGRDLGHDFDVGQIYCAGEKNTNDRTLILTGEGTLRASVQLMSVGTICFDNTSGNNLYGTPVVYTCPPCGASITNKMGYTSCNMHIGGWYQTDSVEPKIQFKGLTASPFEGYINARSDKGYAYAIFNDCDIIRPISQTATNNANYWLKEDLNTQPYANYLFRVQGSSDNLYLAMTNSALYETTLPANTTFGNYIGKKGVVELSKSSLHLDLLKSSTKAQEVFRGTFIIDDSVFEAERGPATVTNLTLKGANSLMRNNAGIITNDGPMAITYPASGFTNGAPIEAASVALTTNTTFTIDASALVEARTYPVVKATTTDVTDEAILSGATITVNEDLGLFAKLVKVGNDIKLVLTRRFEAATEGTKDLFVPDDFFASAPTTETKYGDAQTWLSGTNDNGVVRWHAYVAGFTELDNATMVTKPITGVTVTLDSWPTTPAPASGYGVTYSLIRSTNPSSDFTDVEGTPSFKEGSSVPIFDLPLPEGGDKLYFYRIKAIYKKE